MLKQIISKKKQEWLDSQECGILPLINYIRNKGALRDAQIEAIETYLFLKIKGENKSLWKLISEGFFGISACAELGNYPEESVRRIFYGVNYTDYLFSLPMGAGKTFLMAAFIYLDLYFAETEPDNPVFAHNFIILAPSGLKSSIVPSLKTIENFDPTWVVPEPAASNIRKLVRFEILDQSKSVSKSNKTKIPNAQKISRYQPFEDLKGLVMVVNAEKVILDRLKLTNQLELIEKNEDDKDRQANELRNLIDKIPNLCIHIDEVHHAATDDIKLRQVVNKWAKNRTVNSVIGYSGTPYLSAPDKIPISETKILKFKQITNTVYYYPMTRAIRNFLKKPRVEVASGLEPLKIIKKGVNDFYKHYKDKIYDSGICAKLAIYCGTIQRLENEIYPFLIEQMNIPADEILKYHKGNKDFKLPKENEAEFNALDIAVSKKQKRIILLVQVGKEGWDCRSLTGVILAQKGDSPANMVLQTSCRCLRQVDKGKHETALIWLNDANAKILDRQLKDEQDTSIGEINRLSNEKKSDMIERFSRMTHLNLPEISFYQLKVEYSDERIEQTPDTANKLKVILNDKNLYNQGFIVHRGLDPDDPKTRSFIEKQGSEPANFHRWLLEISKASFDFITISDLLKFEDQLKTIFQAVTFEENGKRYLNELYNQSAIQSKIRLAFHCKRELKTRSEVIPQNSTMLIVENLSSVQNHDLLYPNQKLISEILRLDNTGKSVKELEQLRDAENKRRIETFIHDETNPFAPGRPELIPPLSLEIRNKDNTFHYLPYNFWQSRFERDFLKEALTLQEIQERNLEIHYNGEKQLTDFRISCYSESRSHWKYIGKYTPDFLMIQRENNAIHKVLIIETKGLGFADQKGFTERKKFVETEFLKMNNEKFGYRKFEYLYELRS